jgi:biotin transport system substrate-specific component
MSTVVIPSRRNLADAIPSSLTANLALVIGAAGFVGLLAQFAIHLRFSPVPITGQTLGVVLAGAALGWRRASLSMALYVVAGLAGVPWFANHASGYVNANFGYLLGFIAAGTIVGSLAARSGRSLVRSFFTMVVGDLVIFGFGVTWLALALHVSLTTALHLGFTPFLIGDVIKMVLASLILPATWSLVDHAERR